MWLLPILPWVACTMYDKGQGVMDSPYYVAIHFFGLMYVVFRACVWTELEL